MNRTPLRGDDVRIRNEKIVLHLVFRSNVISQSQIVQETGLKAPTVFRIFTKLEEEGYIRQCTADEIPEQPTNQDRKGRRPSFYCVVPTCCYAIGVDFSTVAASVIAVDFANRVIHQESTEFIPGQGRAEILTAIETLIGNTMRAHGIVREKLLGIGIASPGVVDTVTGVVLEYERIAGLRGYPLKAHFEQRFTVPVLVHNNASVIAASAYHYGVAREEKSLLTILVRSGVGGALITHGNLFLNGTATALEIGRTAVHCIPPGAGREEIISLESVAAEQPLLSRIKEKQFVRSWEEAEEKFTADDLTEVLQTARAALGTAALNLNHIFHPTAILLIARFSLIADVLGAAVRDSVPNCRIISMVYDPVQACYGATDLVFQKFFGYSDAATLNDAPST